ncbi:MAG: histidine kinase, partial [Acidobacteria bacterium]|nr:histidine kinase [Acidobacteriota bacterium]
YLLEQVPQALSLSLDGLERVATIVRSMKEFAHPDRHEMAPVDLNRALQSTLIVARNEYRYVADAVVGLAPLPPVVCHGGEINQAVLNIVVNAAHAIEAKVRGTGERGRIGVRSWQDGSHVVIAIDDTGGGIPAEIAGQVFDPFFTTKAAGEGSGQGLAIARAVVVDKHGGNLTFDVKPGVGTTFYLRLPIDGRAASAAA